MKASRIIKPKESLQVQQIKTPVPSGSQVLIKFNRQKSFVKVMDKV
jgi:NADPH:quinone reductase-like Zn-dependent oxidoreductase